MTDVFLGVIAVSVLAMAIGQVTAVVAAARAARRIGESLGRLEETIRPIVSNVEQISADAKRATAIATAQVQRAEHLMDEVTRRIEETLNAVQDNIVAPARSGWAFVQGLREVLGSFFDRAPRRSRGHAAGPSRAAAEDDASFIG